jgi:hypothetical protein
MCKDDFKTMKSDTQQQYLAQILVTVTSTWPKVRNKTVKNVTAA